MAKQSAWVVRTEDYQESPMGAIYRYACGHWCANIWYDHPQAGKILKRVGNRDGYKSPESARATVARFYRWSQMDKAKEAGR